MTYGRKKIDSAAIAELVAMDRKAFKLVVEVDIKATSPDFDAEDPSYKRFHLPLRSAEVCERWFQMLVSMKKRNEMTLGAKSLDNKVMRLDMEKVGDLAKLAREHRKYLLWRATSIRFQTGVEEALTEAAFSRWEHFENQTKRIEALEDAIRRHREAAKLASKSDDDVIPRDTDLWSALD